MLRRALIGGMTVSENQSPRRGTARRLTRQAARRVARSTSCGSPATGPSSSPATSSAQLWAFTRPPRLPNYGRSFISVTAARHEHRKRSGPRRPLLKRRAAIIFLRHQPSTSAWCRMLTRWDITPLKRKYALNFTTRKTNRCGLHQCWIRIHRCLIHC